MNKIELQNRTKKFAIAVFKMVEALPKGRGVEVIINQLVKSSTSVAANYRAACRAKSKPDFINKLKIVEEEADESLFWLEFLLETEVADKSTLSTLLKEADELVAIFTSSLKTIKSTLQPTKPVTTINSSSNSYIVHPKS